MICKYCGKEMVDQSRFCPNCGQPVKIETKKTNHILPAVAAVSAAVVLVGAGAGIAAAVHMRSASETTQVSEMNPSVEEETTVENVVTGWQQDDHGWKYFDENGNPQAEGWFTDEDGSQYYFGADGYMLADTVTPDGYFVNESGAYVSWEVINAEKNRQAVAGYREYLQKYIADPYSFPITLGCEDEPLIRLTVLDINNDGIDEVLLYPVYILDVGSELLYYTDEGVQTAEIPYSLNSYNPTTGQIYSIHYPYDEWTGCITTFDGMHVSEPEEIHLFYAGIDRGSNLDSELEKLKRIEQYETGGAYPITGVVLTADSVDQYLTGDGMSTIDMGQTADSYQNAYDDFVKEYQDKVFRAKEQELRDSVTQDDMFIYEFKHIDLNRDGVEELVAFQNANPHTYGVLVWVYKNGNLKEVGELHEYSYAWITENNNIMFGGIGHASGDGACAYRMNGETFELIDHVRWVNGAYHEPPLDHDVYYRMSDSQTYVCEITEEEYCAILDSF